MSEQGLVNAAIESARWGLRVFPVAPRGKKPLLRGWQRSATIDITRIEEMWCRVPDANVGVACGSGLVVIDADSRDGEQALRALGVPDTPTVVTGRGKHFYLAGSSHNRVALLPGVDVRGYGGYVVGAGSQHPNGAEYLWDVAPWEAPRAPVPHELRVLLAGPRTSEPRGRASTIVHGERNVKLFQLACALRGRSGLGSEEIRATLLSMNERRCVPPLDALEVESIAASAAKYDSAPLWAIDPVGFAADPALGGRERLLLAALARYCNQEGACWPGVRRLRADTGLATDTIESATRVLVERGRITVERRRGASN
jgi:hypothetical protein